MATQAHSKDSACQQVATLKRLRQASLAYLLDVSPRTVRDWPDCPRNPDATYNAQAVVRWRRNRLDRPVMTDDHLEQLLVAVDELELECEWWEFAKMGKTLQTLRDAYGDHALLNFADQLIQRAGTHVSEDKQEPGDKGQTLSDDELLEILADIQLEQDLLRPHESVARRELKIAAMCSGCGRLRRGSRWVKGEPPTNWCVNDVLCPACDRP